MHMHGGRKPRGLTGVLDRAPMPIRGAALVNEHITNDGPATCERPAPHERPAGHWRPQSYDVARARERAPTVEVTDAHEVAESRTTTKRSFSTSGPQEGLAAPSSTKKLPGAGAED